LTLLFRTCFHIPRLSNEIKMETTGRKNSNLKRKDKHTVCIKHTNSWRLRICDVLFASILLWSYILFKQLEHIIGIVVMYLSKCKYFYNNTCLQYFIHHFIIKYLKIKYFYFLVGIQKNYLSHFRFFFNIHQVYYLTYN